MTALLVGDIGGTHTRLAITEGSGFTQLKYFRNDDYPDVYRLLREYRGALPGSLAPHAARLAVAAPVGEGTLRLSNREWELDGRRIRELLGVERLGFLNDFVAMAWGLSTLAPEGYSTLNTGIAHPHAARVVLGPGTGLGVAALVPCGDHWAVASSEGGHASLAADDPDTHALLASLADGRQLPVEALVSGPGLLRLYHACGGVPALVPEQVVQRARRGEAAATAAVSVFFRLLGGLAGNLALTFDARGGIFLAGSLLNGLRAELAVSDFRAACCVKRAYREYLEAIPCHLVHDPMTALRGAASALWGS